MPLNLVQRHSVVRQPVPARATEYNNIVPGGRSQKPFKRRRDVAKKSGTVPQKIITVGGEFKWRVARHGSHLPFQISTFQFLRSTFNVQRTFNRRILCSAFFFFSPTKQRQSVGSDHLRNNGECSFFLLESVRMTR